LQSVKAGDRRTPEQGNIVIELLKLSPRFTPPGAAREAQSGLASAGAVASKDSFNMTRRFLVLCLVAIATVSVTSSIVLSRFIVAEGLGRDARVAAQYVQNSVLQRHAAGYFGAPHEPTPERAEVERFLADLLWMPEVLRTQVYSDRGQVLWSSHVPAARHTFEGNPELDRALRGELVVEADFLKWSSQAKPEHLYSAELKAQFAEYYIPVWNADRSRVIGVVEIYKGPQSLFASILQSIRLVWLCDALGGLAIFLSLCWVMRRGQRIIERQQRRLASDEGFVAVGEVAASVAHNLRNPLGAIRTSAELLAIDAKSGRPSADLCRYADDIVQDVDRLEDWIRRLLEHAKAGSRSASPIGLNALVGRVVEAVDGEAAERKVIVRWLAGTGADTVRAEPLLLEQVLRTLVDNALDAMPEGGDLAIRTGFEGRCASIVIEDSGIGMRPEQVARLFRVPASTKPRGLGIGLPLVARTLERMGGRIEVRSESGRGTRVAVSLPLSVEVR